jgi:hypothetical protein
LARVSKETNDEILAQEMDFLSSASKALRKEPDLPSICEFAEHPAFLGRKLYPRQKTLLKLINLEVENFTDYDLEVIDKWIKGFSKNGVSIGISPDVWKRIEYLKDNGYSHFKEVINITGRRGGKGHIGGILGAYNNWKLIQLDDPQWYYGIDRSKDVYLFCAATNIQQAKAYQFADLANTIIDAECFKPYIAEAKEYFIALRTPADTRRIAAFEARGIRPQRLIASVRNMAITSNSKASRGAACFTVMFDEFAHMLVGTDGPRTSDEVYNAIVPALDQFGKDGFIYIPTSPFTKIGKCYELYQHGLMENQETGEPVYPNMLIVQLPSWGPYEDWDDPRATEGFQFRSAPQLYNEEMQKLEQREPSVFKVERLSQWADVMDAYLDPVQIEKMYEPFIDGSGKLRYLEEQEEGVLAFVYRGHCDPSKSQANTAAMICHVEQIPNPEDGELWSHIITDWMHVWNPEDYDDHQIDYEQVEEDIVRMINKFPTLKVFSYDQYGSFVTISRLKKRLRESRPPHKAIVTEDTFTPSANMKRAERFKSALGMGWIHAYKDNYGKDNSCLLQNELRFLQEVNGKIKKQDVGPIQTKDLADCLMVCVDQLLEDNFRRLETRDRLGSTKLLYGGQGGYHTPITMGTDASEQSSARAKLNSLSRQGQFDYGAMARRARSNPRR